LPLLCRARGIAVRPEPQLLAHPTLRGQAPRNIGVRTQKIVEVKKHRRALRRGGHQIAKLPKRMGLNHVAFVRGEVPLHFAFPCKNVEMVEPEIVHHLLQLPLAVNRP